MWWSHRSIRRARPLSESLFSAWNEVLLFRTLATLRLDVPVFDTAEALFWRGPRQGFEGQISVRGSLRYRLPVSRDSALTMAGEITGMGGSPQPEGFSLLGTM